VTTVNNGHFEFLKKVFYSLQPVIGFVLLESDSENGKLSVRVSEGKVPPFFKEGFFFTSEELTHLINVCSSTSAIISVLKDSKYRRSLILYLKRPLSKDALLLIQTLLTTFEREDLSFGIKELEYMAYHDPLTGLPNRRYLFELGKRYLDLAKREGKKVFVLFMDLAGFKAINDTYGHLVGDEILRTVSKRILDRVRRSDVVARYGGDEFTILLYDMKEEYLKSFLERILSAFREPVRVRNTVLTVASNIGVARFPEDGENLEELLKVADMRMYRAKEMRTPYLLRS